MVSGTGVKPGGIVINDDGRIERVTGPSEEPASAQNVIDAGGKMLFPGFVDAHVHMGWYYDYFSQQHAWNGLNGQGASLYGATAGQNVLPSNAIFIGPPN